MVNDDMSLFSGDPVLTSLRNLNIEALHHGIQHSVPAELLDAPVPSYKVSNLRYSPSKKMIVGMTSEVSQRPISLRIFPRDALQNRLDKARRSHPDHSFLMDELNAIAWVFPGERKMNLDMVANRSRLAAVIREHRGYELKDVELLHFVPEHTYTAKVTGVRSGGQALVEYIKIYYDDQGLTTSRIMRELLPQLDGARIRIPDDVSYVAESRLLIQSEVMRDASRSLSYHGAASALAAFHGLSAASAPLREDDVIAEHTAVIELVRSVLPAQLGDVVAASSNVQTALLELEQPTPVLVHGDAHLGNLYPIANGRTGVIDLDRVAWGRADDDIASFLAFAIWLRLRNRHDPKRVLGELPSFVAIYNRMAMQPVSCRSVYLRLAHKLIAERVRRGIARGKVSGASEILAFVRIAEQCVDAARHCDRRIS